MRSRVLLVAVLVLVLGAWTCAPTNSPGSGGSDVPISTTGLTALVGGEDWHYVGDTGEPAFSGSWTNVSLTKYNLAFRIRESGVVDLQGLVDDGGAGPALLFTLPAGYRPTSRAYCDVVITSTGGANEAGFLIIETDGTVSVNWSSGVTGVEVIIASGQFFLDPPSAP